jgi:hypothetical protein
MFIEILRTCAHRYTPIVVYKDTTEMTKHTIEEWKLKSFSSVTHLKFEAKDSVLYLTETAQVLNKYTRTCILLDMKGKLAKPVMQSYLFIR